MCMQCTAKHQSNASRCVFKLNATAQGYRWTTYLCSFVCCCPCTAGSNAPRGTQPAAFTPCANSMLFGHLSAAQPRSLAQGKLLTRSSLASNASTRGAKYSQQQLQPAGRTTLQGYGMQGRAAGDMSSQLGSCGSSAQKAVLPGGVAWGQFVSGQQAPAVAVPPVGVPDEADDGSQPLDQQGSQQQHLPKQAARAAWQRPAGASNFKRSSTASVFTASSFGSSSFRLQGAAASWGSPWQGQDPFEEQQAPAREASLPAAAAPPPVSMPASAAAPAAPSSADQPPDASTAREPIRIADALDIGDIFAFMR